MKSRLLSCWVLVLISPLFGCGPRELTFAPLTSAERNIIKETWAHAQQADGESVLAVTVVSKENPHPITVSQLSRLLSARLESAPWVKGDLEEIEQVPTPSRLISGIIFFEGAWPDMVKRIREGEVVLVRLSLSNDRQLYQAWLREDDGLQLLGTPLDLTEPAKRMIMGEEVPDEDLPGRI